MLHPIAVPRAADGALAVTILRWIKSVGDDVRKGEDLVEAKTEKITLYITAPVSGKLAEVLIQAGAKVKVGEVVGHVEG